MNSRADCEKCDPEYEYGGFRTYGEPFTMNGNNHTIEKTLEERGAQYGPWDRHAATAQQLMHIIDLGLTAQRLSHSQRESLHMICHKIGRIVNGNCNFTDSWVDIAGYAQLIVNQLQESKLNYVFWPAPTCPDEKEAENFYGLKVTELAK